MELLKKVNLQFFADDPEKVNGEEVVKEEIKQEEVKEEKATNKEDLEQAYKNKFAEGARKATQKFLEELGVKSIEEAKELLQKPKTNDSELESIKTELKQLQALKQLNDLNVDKQYQEDVIALIKGKGKEVNEESIKEIISKYPSWTTTSKDNKQKIERIGSDGNTNVPEVSEEELANKLFGIK